MLNPKGRVDPTRRWSGSQVVRLLLEACVLLYALYFWSYGSRMARSFTDVHSVAELRVKLEDVAQHAGANAPVHDLISDLARTTKAASEARSLAETVKRAAAVAAAPRAAPPPAEATCARATGSADDLALQQRAAMDALTISNSHCHLEDKAEYWGDVVMWGGEHRTDTPAECCAACHAHRRTAQRGGLEDGFNSTVCNVWVHCSEPKLCGNRYKECWLKHVALPPLPGGQPPGGSRGASVPWTSGAVYTDEEEFPTGKGGTLTLLTSKGPIAVELRPDLAPKSVVELKRMATWLSNGSCTGCQLYRSEANFLLQGVIRAPGFYIAVPRNPSPPQPKIMERGLTCWAGGAGGPDFFINLIDQAGFGDSHLCWGKITADMALVDAIVALPLKPKAKPNDMTFLAEFVKFNVSLSG